MSSPGSNQSAPAEPSSGTIEPDAQFSRCASRRYDEPVDYLRHVDNRWIAMKFSGRGSRPDAVFRQHETVFELLERASARFPENRRISNAFFDSCMATQRTEYAWQLFSSRIEAAEGQPRMHPTVSMCNQMISYFGSLADGSYGARDLERAEKILDVALRFNLPIEEARLRSLMRAARHDRNEALLQRTFDSIAAFGITPDERTVQLHEELIRSY